MINKLVLGLLVGAAVSGTAAQTITDIQVPSDNAYSQDSRGTVTRSAYGLCWRSGTWSSNDAIAGCDGALAPPITDPTAPDIATNPGEIVPPTTAHAANSCDFAITLESDQTFAFNKALLNRNAKKRIDMDVLPRITACKTIAITITGHTDAVGSSQSNQKLSAKRAASVANYLNTKGIRAPITTIGVGETQAIKACDGNLERTKLVACLAPNRRVLIEARGL